MTINDAQLKAALSQLAEGLPASKDPWSEHERRMNARARARRRRITIGVAAAAVLLLLGIAVPIVLTRNDPAPPPVAAQPSKVQLGPVRIEDYVDGGFDYWGSVERSRDIGGAITDTLCLESAHRPRPNAADSRRDGLCRTSMVDDDGPARIHPIATGRCDGDRVPAGLQCPMVNGLVIVTEPEVARVEIDAVGWRSSTTALEVGRTDGLVLFQAALERSGMQNDINQDRFTYTARDADGNVIDQVTLRGLG